MSISSTMLISVMAAFAVVGMMRTWTRSRKRQIEKTARHWDEFADACRNVIAKQPRSEELLDLVAFINRLLRIQNGAWLVVGIIIQRAVRYILRRSPSRKRGNRMSPDDGAAYVTILTNGLALLACKNPVSGVVINVWLSRLRSAGAASAGQRAVSLSADVHALKGGFGGGAFNPA